MPSATLAHPPAPLPNASTAAPPPAPSTPPHSRPARSAALDRWRESEDEDDWSAPVSRKEGKGKEKAVKGEDAGEERERERKAAQRAKRAVASEAWDDDFLFQEDPPPPPTPRRSSSHATSSSRSRPTTPSHRHTSSASQVPSTPSSRRSHGSPPSSPHRGFSFSGPATLSLDSLASSIAWTSDHEPTLTVPPTHSGPISAATTPRPAPRQPHQTHHASASTSTTRPPLYRQTTPRSRIPKLSSSPSRDPPPSSSIESSPPTDWDYRTDTPGLTEDSCNSLTTGEEIVTEPEGDDPDSGTDVAVAPALQQGAQGLGSRIKSISGSRKWRFGRRGSGSKEDPPQVLPPPPSSRRAQPEVMVIDRAELSRARLSNSPRSGLPRPLSRSHGGKTSSSTAGSGSTSSSLPQRVKHSSGASVSTSSTSEGRARRTSLQFAPPPIVPPSFSRRGSLASPHSPSESVAFSWREYTGTTTEGEEDDEDDDDGETTGADLSDFSGDEGARRSGRGRRVGRGGATKGGMRTASAITPSTSFATMSTRPVSPVESILGGDRSRWNASQVSFASTASAFALRSGPPSGFAAGASGADASQGKKRKLTKRRPSSGILPSASSHDALSAPSLATNDRPLLAPSIFSTSSGGSSQPSSSGRTILSRARSYHRAQPTLPFAEDSDVERPPRQRSVTNPTQQQQAASERGQVVELDTEWLGVVPFPPSPRPSLEQREAPSAPPTPSRSSLRSPSHILRKVSGAAGKSHPPVTARTQGEAKASRRGSGLGQALTNLLSRSTSALPLGGKRAPSPAPSGKSVKSSKSALLRRPSSRASRIAQDEAEPPELPKSPSLSALRKRTSGFAQAPPPMPLALPPSASMPLLQKPPPHRPSPTPTASSAPPTIPRSSSTFSFMKRPRGFSRSAPKEVPPPPPPPVSPRRPAFRQPSFEETPRPAPTRPSRTPRPSAAPNSATPRAAPPRPAARGQLNADFKMPRPVSNVSTVSSSASGTTDATESTLTPLGGYRDAAAARASRTQAQVPPVPPLPRYARPVRPHMGHRPSVSLSSIMPSRAPSPRPPPARSKPGTPEPHAALALELDEPHRPLTALGGPLKAYQFDDDLALSDGEGGLPRRNSLSDLRIPARITNAQKKIEEDLERVKQFAKAVEELKALRRQYDQLIQIFAEPPSSQNHLSPEHGPSPDALHKTAQAARRVEIDYSAWWEQAQTLIDLGDGKPAKEKASPGTLASRRDRCVSLAPEKTPPRVAALLPSESETETEATFATAALGRNGSTARRLRRRPSASSFETEASVAVRQREMLRGVLAPALKGASLPSRAPPAPRPPLPRLESGLSKGKRLSGVPLGHAHTISPTTPRSPSTKPLPPATSRRVSRGGVFGIREFLLRLRSKATEELAASVGTIPSTLDASLPSSSAPSPARRSVSDPASRPLTPHQRASSTLRPSAPPATSSSSPPPAHHSSSESDEDWDADLAVSPPRNSLLSFDTELSGPLSAAAHARRERTRSVIVAGATSGGGAGAAEKMVLTTEAMPHLLDKVREVREACEACIGLLKGLTV
ncbi:hypothetical protein JCM10450v2_000853 [Rhodotorula kratochvilovae]